jgi:hypothetical protein
MALGSDRRLNSARPRHGRPRHGRPRHGRATHCLAAALMTLALVVPAAGAPRPLRVTALDWTPFRDARLGYTFAFPAKVFAAEAGDPTLALKARTEKRSGQIFRSKDGKAFLQTAAFANVDKVTAASYKGRVAASYSGAKIEYERLADSFFVISGVRGKEVFYERVTFSCGGRVINAWAMTYPQAEGALYDRIVEEVARTFRPVEGRESCS